MAERRRIAVVTGTRADYGLLRPLLRRLAGLPAVELQLIATAMHLAPEFGLTIRHIEADGFLVTRRVEMLLASDTPAAIAKSIGLGTIGFADALTDLAPDLLVLLGDRFEVLAAAQAALPARIPVAHLHGGEATEGAMDEAIRHAVSKLAHLHFTATEVYRQRVIQLGEDPTRVFNSGATAVDNVRDIAHLPRATVEQRLAFALTAPLFLVTYHPATLGTRPPAAALAELLAALDDFPQARIVLTKANADTGGRAINRLLADYQAARPQRTALFDALGTELYLNTVRYADVVIGNSSSGLIEVPALGTPTVNIGERQGGRVRPPSVIDAAEDTVAIAAAIHRALSPAHRALTTRLQHPYGDGHAAERIAAVLADYPLQGLANKRFFNLA